MANFGIYFKILSQKSYKNLNQSKPCIGTFIDESEHATAFKLQSVSFMEFQSNFKQCFSGKNQNLSELVRLSST